MLLIFVIAAVTEGIIIIMAVITEYIELGECCRRVLLQLQVQIKKFNLTTSVYVSMMTDNDDADKLQKTLH